VIVPGRGTEAEMPVSACTHNMATAKRRSTENEGMEIVYPVCGLAETLWRPRMAQVGEVFSVLAHDGMGSIRFLLHINGHCSTANLWDLFDMKLFIALVTMKCICRKQALILIPNKLHHKTRT
jgi:hypothetical protein